MEERGLKKIAQLRGILEERVRGLETELEGLRALLELVNDILLEQSFKRAESVKPQPPISPPLVATPLTTTHGEILANLYVGEDSMRILLAEGKDFNVDTPPFMTFLHDRVLLKMQERDLEAAEEGEIPQDKVFTFDVKRDGDIITEISVRNVASDRKRELTSAIRWTLEKMYEKTKT